MVDMDSGEGFKYPLSVLHELFEEDKDSIKTPVNLIYHMLCTKLYNVSIKPRRVEGAEVSYDISLCQSRLDQDAHSWCTCLSSTTDYNGPVASFTNAALKKLIDDLRADIRNDEEVNERKMRRLRALQNAYAC
ncbi:uncharacterized protein EV154DRAFT_558177 [Mucor mucedo]|uniref:uncharacterized protein n=1 Tax=Mucor mucedo TaxID=29922 RepID=UPI0022205B15|nr:uncharacterized protein EV154DRAFT_558177 [Mucor mucedo]KAI7896553.1 hypothetical protein EV154DRAFT_558177 [Mucor mucedo]